MRQAESSLLRRLHEAGVFLTVRGDRLLYRCQAGAMTDDLRADLLTWRPELLAEYQERAAIMEFDGGLQRSEAERLAGAAVFDHASLGS